jgi:hypothetical protein
MARGGTGRIQWLAGGQGVGVGRKSTRKRWGADLSQRRNRWELTGRCPQWRSRAVGSRRRQAGGEGEVLTGLVREVLGVALVLTVDEMELDSAGGSQPLVKQPCHGSALWCLLTRQHEDGTHSEEVKPSMRRQLRWCLAWWLVDSIAWRGVARCLDEQGRAEQVKWMRENSEEEKVNMALML